MKPNRSREAEYTVLLGIMAAISDIVYAVAKFLTTLRIRRLRLALTRV